uniref:Uncharacterized protein n=1 Tax=Romanomermis culicivorax TaxID=13658 RepID=A0A915I6E2_ROMCU
MAKLLRWSQAEARVVAGTSSGSRLTKDPLNWCGRCLDQFLVAWHLLAAHIFGEIFLDEQMDTHKDFAEKR